MEVPFVDLKKQYESIKTEIDLAINNVLTSASFIGGIHVKSFEQEFSELYKVKHCIAVGNGTDSLYIVMKMLGIGDGDEVITPANSWISSSETISQTGAKPIFIDVDPVFYTMDETKLNKVISKRTKAIIPVHLFGQVCNMKEIITFSENHGLQVIEDCAQSHFSSLNNIRAGLFGKAGSFSFYPGKNLGAYGDAGCIITNDNELATRCRMYANHGALVKHQHEFEGINSRLDGLQAAVLRVKLAKILDWTEMRKRVAREYTKGLANIEEIVTPKVRDNSEHTFHLYVIRCKERDSLSTFLKENGIKTGIHYPTILPMLKAYSFLNHKKQDFPISYSLQQEILSLPIYPELNNSQIEYVCNKVKEFYSK